jgi:hypothetical protein
VRSQISRDGDGDGDGDGGERGSDGGAYQCDGPKLTPERERQRKTSVQQ